MSNNIYRAFHTSQIPRGIPEGATVGKWAANEHTPGNSHPCSKTKAGCAYPSLRGGQWKVRELKINSRGQEMRAN